jgi:hypothetical protein
MTTDKLCFYLQNRRIQTGGQWYSDTSPFSIPWFIVEATDKDTKSNFGANYSLHTQDIAQACFAPIL